MIRLHRSVVKMQGKIMKGIAGFYYVYAQNEKLYECKAKGIFRNQNVKPLVGDNVELEVLDEENALGNSLVGQWFGLGAFTARTWVRSLVGELISHKTHSSDI